jgi:hypothetical protein
MTYPPQQQPPTVHGYPAQPPNNDWPPAPTGPQPAKPSQWKPWTFGGLGALFLIITVGVGAVLADNATVTKDELPGDAKRECVEELVPARLSAMAEPQTAKFERVTVTTTGDAFQVKGRITADRITNDGFDGLPDRYTFECNMTRVGDEWTSSYALVYPL